MTTMTVEGFRREVEQRRGARRRGAPRYPEELVAFAVQHAQAARASGRSLFCAASELGLSSMTLGAWLRRSGAGPQGRLRKVVLNAAAPVPPTASNELEFTTSSGHVVRGLGIAEVAALLRMLQ
jgi:hypothetical protein